MSWTIEFARLKCKHRLFVGLIKNELSAYLGKDFLYVDRGYWSRSHKFRIIRGGVHLTKLLDRPGDRMQGTELRPWRKEGSFIVVIPPSQYQCAVLPGASTWLKNLDLKTDREVRIKTQKELPFEDYVKGAWAVVSYGSVAAVKALMWGYPVLSGPYCPATPICCEDIENPVLKDRAALFRSLSYAQWTLAEATQMNLDEYDYKCA